MKKFKIVISVGLFIVLCALYFLFAQVSQYLAGVLFLALAFGASFILVDLLEFFHFSDLIKQAAFLNKEAAEQEKAELLVSKKEWTAMEFEYYKAVCDRLYKLAISYQY